MANEDVSALNTEQLINFLTSIGVSQSGCDSVHEKEVTSAMLVEFCEEDIKDVFSQFKDRFCIRKMLRDVNKKQTPPPLASKPNNKSGHESGRPGHTEIISPARGSTNMDSLVTSKTENQLRESETSLSKEQSFSGLSSDQGSPSSSDDSKNRISLQSATTDLPDVAHVQKQKSSNIASHDRINNKDNLRSMSTFPTIDNCTTADSDMTAAFRNSGADVNDSRGARNLTSEMSSAASPANGEDTSEEPEGLSHYENNFDLVQVKQEVDFWSCMQQRQDDAHTFRPPHIPNAHSQSPAGEGSVFPQHEAYPGSSGFPHVHPAFRSPGFAASNAQSHSSSLANQNAKRPRGYETETEYEEQALCLKKVRQSDEDGSPSSSTRTPQQAYGGAGHTNSSCRSLTSSHYYSSPQDLSLSTHNMSHQQLASSQHLSPRTQQVTSSQGVRSNTSSPATQPSSTTPDLDPNFVLDPSSLATLKALAGRHTALEILSKKSQRSSPNSAQKLGSILIRSAAQQAGLWDTTPLLRHIAEPQRQCFLAAIYQVAPHIRSHQSLLWQRLSETLQNRRKYLLDKRLGKRGIPSNSSSSHSTSTSQSGIVSQSVSHDSQSDLADIIRDWQATALQNQWYPVGEFHGSGVNGQANTLRPCIKTEPLE